MTAPTYHDVVVTVNGTDYRVFDQPYSLMLTCTRAAGWELWESFASKIHEPRLIGGEFNNDDFKISIVNHIICERKRDETIKDTD